MSAGRLAPARLAGALSLAVALAGCSVTETFQDLTRVDYKTAQKREPLDIPPDLVTPRANCE